jgi:hypothetical protein
LLGLERSLPTLDIAEQSLASSLVLEDEEEIADHAARPARFVGEFESPKSL